MKKIGYICLLIGVVLFVSGTFLYFGSIKPEDKITISKNDYYLDYQYNFVENIENLRPNSYKELLNTIYTIINSGEIEFTFTCGSSYSECIDDVKKLSNDKEILSTLNSFVHPFNSVQYLLFSINDRDVKVSLKKNYSDKEISEINKEIDNIYSTLVSTDASKFDNILKIHDYIIEKATYDSARVNDKIYDYSSDTAYGPLIENFAICSGYTDAMKLFLDRMNIRNYKVFAGEHIWNAVELDGKWYHLDLTWDDPVYSDGTSIIDYKYFLIDTNTLKNLDLSEHDFNTTIYSELA